MGRSGVNSTYSIVKLGSGLFANLLSLVLGVGLADGGHLALDLVLGVTAASGVGYYLYNAGGSPRAAEKQFESELLASSSIRQHHH